MRHTFLDEEETKNALCDFIRNATKLSMGEEVSRFENDFAKWQGRKHCIMVNSGSSANLVLLQALTNLGKLQRGCRIGVSAVTWATNVMPVLQLGFQPVLVDVEPSTLNVSVRTLQAAGQLDCLFLTHLLGFSDDVSAIQKHCTDNRIVFLEDTCESLGCFHTDTRLGNFGLASTFSTFVGHHMSTIEGGMVLTDDDETADAIRMSRAHGWDRNLSKDNQDILRSQWNISPFYAPYTFYTLGYNVRPTDIQGFLGQIQLRKVDDANKRRKQTYAYIRERMRANPNITLPNQDTSAFAIPVICKSPAILNACIENCTRMGIETRPLVAGNMAKQPFFLPYHDGRDLPGADLLHVCGFYMPNHPDITDEERSDLCDAIDV
jgi:CDP-6-deoxy-D-xylo-4-hexulose-3-dehydrase